MGRATLVRVVGCGLCGSDVEKIGRARGVLGHEIAGALEDGTRVTVMHRVPCGSCERCLAGHESTCAEFGELRIAPGGFAERLRATHVVPLPDAFGELDGVWVEPLACVLRAAERCRAAACSSSAAARSASSGCRCCAGVGTRSLAVDPRCAERLVGSRRMTTAARSTRPS